jgi:uncharacterized protein YciI
MRFLLIAHDARDPEAHDRRMRARDRHLAQGQTMIADGRALFGTAILDDEGNIIGSMLVMDFPTRQEFDAWLRTEPYVVEGVWGDVQVHPCRVGPAFLTNAASRGE